MTQRSADPSARTPGRSAQAPISGRTVLAVGTPTPGGVPVNVIGPFRIDIADSV